MTPHRRRLVDLRTGWILVAVGLACGSAAAIMLVSSVGPAVDDALLRDACATPCTEVRDLEKGRYLVFERVGSTSTIGPFSARTQGPATISPAGVTVTSASGRVLEMAQPSTSESIDRGGTTYGGVVSFRVPEAGRYRISVNAPGETRVIVAPGLGQTFVKALPGLAVAGLGLLVGLGGLVVLILAWSRRRVMSTEHQER